MKKIRFIITNLSVLLFLLNNISAQNYFDGKHIINNKYNSPNAITPVDFDFDGDIDIVTGNWSDSIAWFRNNGAGSFDDPVLINKTLDNIKSVFVYDIDNDGDYDVFSASKNDNTIAWIENYDNYNFSTPKIITNSLNYARFVAAYDMDNDGDVDVIGSGAEEIVWYENDGNNNFVNPRVIEYNNNSGRILCFSDFDLDGYYDILSRNYILNTKQLVWYKNNGDRTFTTQLIDIPIDYNYSNYIYVFDLNGDQKDDFIFSVYEDFWDKVLIFRNTGNGNFEFVQSLTIKKAILITADDFDNDGDGDIIIYSDWDNNLTLAKNDEMYFNTEEILGGIGFAKALNKADLNNDNDMDILISSNTGFFWTENYLLNILQQPESSTVCSHEPTTFSIIAKDAFSYRWEVYGYKQHSYFYTPDEYQNEDFENLESNLMTVINPTIELDSLLFRCKVQNNGGSIYSDTVTLNILKDNEPPTLKTKSSVLYLKDGVQTEIPVAYAIDEVSDDCGYIDTTLSKSVFDCTDIGENTILVTAADGTGNSTSEYVTVTVRDTISPDIVFQPDTVRFFSANKEFRIESGLADPDLIIDNCGISSVTNSITGTETLEGAVFPAGNTEVEWTATDINGNISKFKMNVLVTDYNEYSVYPNPFNDYLIVTQKYEGDYSVNIFDLTGKTVYQVSGIRKQWFPLDLGFLNKGMYIAKIFSGDKETTLKIIKTK